MGAGLDVTNPEPMQPDNVHCWKCLLQQLNAAYRLGHTGKPEMPYVQDRCTECNCCVNRSAGAEPGESYLRPVNKYRG